MPFIILDGMFTSRQLSLNKLFGLLMILQGMVSACSLVGVGADDPTPTPLPTSSVPGIAITPPQACLVAEHGMVRVYRPQGDLIAWSPTANTLAYVASTKDSSWNVGELTLLSAPLFNNPIRLATQVAGELSWSPKAIFIAYLGLRRSDNLYTIGLVNSDGRATRDFFPAEQARTDSYGSLKAILEWMDEARLRVFTSCGIDCLQGMDIGVLTGLITPLGDPIGSTPELWSVHTNQLSRVPAEYSDLAGQLNWSPDENSIAYIDENGSAWVIEVPTGSMYPLDIGTYGTAIESDWSYDSQYLALQVDQNLKVFSFDCP
jgi:hypothetical protein